MVKQTKPFGRSTPVAVPPSDANAAIDTFTLDIVLDSVLPTEQVAAQHDLYRSSAQGIPERSMAGFSGPSRWRKTGRFLGSFLGLVIAFVFLRDSMLLANMLQSLTTDETVMVCKDGKVLYEGYNPWDRLMGRGHFVCTEWKTQSGFLTSPLRRR